MQFSSGSPKVVTVVEFGSSCCHHRNFDWIVYKNHEPSVQSEVYVTRMEPVFIFHLCLFLLFQRKAVAVRCGRKAFKPQSCCHRPTSLPLPCVTPNGVVMTATWVSTPSLTTSRRPTNTHNNTTNRHLSIIRPPWITSMEIYRLPCLLHWSHWNSLTINSAWIEVDLYFFLVLTF